MWFFIVFFLLFFLAVFVNLIFFLIFFILWTFWFRFRLIFSVSLCVIFTCVVQEKNIGIDISRILILRRLKLATLVQISWFLGFLSFFSELMWNFMVLEIDILDVGRYIWHTITLLLMIMPRPCRICLRRRRFDCRHFSHTQRTWRLIIASLSALWISKRRRFLSGLPHCECPPSAIVSSGVLFFIFPSFSFLLFLFFLSLH